MVNMELEIGTTVVGTGVGYGKGRRGGTVEFDVNDQDENEFQ